MALTKVSFVRMPSAPHQSIAAGLIDKSAPVVNYKLTECSNLLGGELCPGAAERSADEFGCLWW